MRNTRKDILMDTGVTEGGLLPTESKDELAANRLIRRFVLSLEELTTSVLGD